MGAGFSQIPFQLSTNVKWSSPLWQAQFDTLRLETMDLLKLQKIFETIKSKHPLGRIEVQLFFKASELEQKKFLYKAFAVFRQDGNEECFLDFRDFVFSLWNFCTLDENAMGTNISFI